MSEERAILVAVESESSADDVLAAGIEAARPRDARLHIVHVIQRPPAAYPDYGLETLMASLENSRSEARTWLEELAKRASEAGVDAATTLITGSATDEIVGLAEAVDAELVVVGTHGHTGIKRLALGSTAESVVRHAPCNVLVVKPEPSSEDEENHEEEER